MITIKMIGDTELAARFSELTPRLRAALLKKVYGLTIRLATKVRRKLSGEVLNVRSGNLRASIHEDLRNLADAVTGRVYSSGDVKYGAVHEYGGTIPAHDVVPVKAKALRFMLNGKEVFARRVRIPDVKMPERSFMRSSLSEMKPQIIGELQGTVKSVAEKK